MANKFSVPRGTTDILPSQVLVWQTVEQKARRVIEDHGYREIRTPFFEDTELFARSMGQTSDVVQKQMLNIASQKDTAKAETLSGMSLRPESTAAIVRSYINNSLDRQEGLSRLYYIGPMFRGERPQKGRLRQFHQIGVEAIGPDSKHPYLDAEVIALAVNILKALGLKEFKLKLNTLGSTQDKEALSATLRKELDSWAGKLCPDCQKRMERNVFRVLDCKNKSCQGVVRSLNIGHGHLSAQSMDHYEKVKEALKTLNVEFLEDPLLVRGLDYYTHTVFEITTSALGSQDALGAGGRYDGLVKQLGGPDVGATGFALGIERILLAMPKTRKEDHPGPAAYVMAMDEAAFSKAFELAGALREAGIACAMSYRVSSLKSQMRQAAKSNAAHALIIGEEEIKNNAVTVKDMARGTQEQVGVKQGYAALIKALRQTAKKE